jgi:hypothetical protein
MKKEELKKLIKPLIKECLKEVLIEEGLTKMLSENVGSSIKLPTSNNNQPPKPNNQLQENRKKMLDSIGRGGFDPFAGSEPLKEDKQLISGDPGIDISGLIGENKKVWKQTLNALNGKKDKE